MIFKYNKERKRIPDDTIEHWNHNWYNNMSTLFDLINCLNIGDKSICSIKDDNGYYPNEEISDIGELDLAIRPVKIWRLRSSRENDFVLQIFIFFLFFTYSCKRVSFTLFLKMLNEFTLHLRFMKVNKSACGR